MVAERTVLLQIPISLKTKPTSEKIEPDIDRSFSFLQLYPPIMALNIQRAPYETVDRRNRPTEEDELDQEEDAMAQDYSEQVHFEDGMNDLDRTASYGSQSGPQDIQAQLQAAATPLEYQATLETKFASYDNYCSLFHYILNSEGPVDLDVPTVGSLLPNPESTRHRLTRL